MTVLKLKTKSTPYTYILEWPLLGKRYIGARWASGCHPSDLWDSYFTSSKYVHDFVKEHGKPEIIWIDKTFENANDAMSREIDLLNQYDVKNNESFLNKSIGGKFNFNDPEIRKRMRDSHLGKKHSPEWIEWITKFHRTRARSKETNAKIRAALTGKNLSYEHRLAISGAKKGKPSHMLGKKHSDETKNMIRFTKTGSSHSEETKKKCQKLELVKNSLS